MGADNPQEARRFKRRQTQISSGLMGKVGLHLLSELVCLLGAMLVLGIGAASVILFCAYFGDVTLEELTGWVGRPPLAFPLLLAAVWAAVVPLYALLASDMETVVSVLFALILGLLAAPLLLFAAIIAGGAVFTLPFGILMTVLAIDTHGFWFCFSIFAWSALMSFPLLLGFFRSG